VPQRLPCKDFGVDNAPDFTLVKPDLVPTAGLHELAGLKQGSLEIGWQIPVARNEELVVGQIGIGQVHRQHAVGHLVIGANQ